MTFRGVLLIRLFGYCYTKTYYHSYNYPKHLIGVHLEVVQAFCDSVVVDWEFAFIYFNTFYFMYFMFRNSNKNFNESVNTGSEIFAIVQKRMIGNHLNGRYYMWTLWFS